MIIYDHKENMQPNYPFLVNHGIHVTASDVPRSYVLVPNKFR